MSIKIVSGTKVYENPWGYGDAVRAVQNVSLDINEGSYTLICGPTGSGKTTLVSLLIGIIKPTEGDVSFGVFHLSTSTDGVISSFREKYIGYVPQNPLLIKELNILENILYPNTFYKNRLKELKTNALHLLEKLDLLAKKKVGPFELSGGEIKKVMIARALVKNPLYIFADEPYSELDEEGIHAILKILEEYHQRGSAVIIATQSSRAIRELKKDVDIYTIKKGLITDYKKGGK